LDGIVKEESPAGRITALKAEKGRTRTVGVFVDGRHALSLCPAIGAALAVGQALDGAALADLARRDAAERALQEGVAFLARRARSLFETRRHLQRRGHSPEAAAEALERLARSGTLNDEEYAASWIRGRLRLNPRSGRALRRELLQKGVSRETIARALAGFNDEEAAWAALKGGRRWSVGDRRVLARRMASFLSRRGFDPQTVRTVCEKALGRVEGLEDDVV
jgi:regulatory protein